MISILLNGETAQVSKQKAKIKKSNLSEFKLPKKNNSNNRVFEYLVKKRLIDKDIVSFFMDKQAIYEEQKHHNAVFVGYDENGRLRQACERSTNTKGERYRCTVKNSNSDYGFSYMGISGKVYVFECAIDMMSFITLSKENRQKDSYISLDGLSAKALLKVLEVNKNLQEIILCMDNDKAGMNARHRIKEVLEANGYSNVYSLLPKNKDWNDDLVADKMA